MSARAPLLLLLSLLFALPACNDEPSPPSAPAAYKPVVAWDLPDFTAVDQTGRAIGKKELLGKVWVGTFFFIRCTGPCPDMIRGLSELSGESKDIDDLRLVAFTFQPENDTVEELAAYAKSWNADPDRWHFLRCATAQEVSELQEVGFKSGSPDHHTARFFLVDQQGRVRRWWDCREESDRVGLLRDVRALLAGKEPPLVGQ